MTVLVVGTRNSKKREEILEIVGDCGLDVRDLTAWPDTFDTILAREPRVVVPGHGDPVDAEFVRYHRDGLHELISLKAGVGRGETTEVAAVAASRYPSDVTLAALATP